VSLPQQVNNLGGKGEIIPAGEGGGLVTIGEAVARTAASVTALSAVVSYRSVTET